MISIKTLRAKEPACFISWSKGQVINRRTFKRAPIKYAQNENDVIAVVSKDILKQGE